MHAPTPRKLVLGLVAAMALLFAAEARADALVDLVRAAGDAPSARTGIAGKAGRKSLRKAARKTNRLGRQANKAQRRGRGKLRAPRLQLTAEQRGSGTVQTLDLGGPVSLDEGPAIAPKAGFTFARPSARDR